ncbi:MAG: calcium/sodium antiporter [Planctomycetes bacterium]|nr:calcium/sodium antiporter [Planctomycetota bacterium]
MSGLAAAGALLLGLLLLSLGAEWLVKGSVGLGRRFGISPLILGLTVVAYGTSMPELVVSAAAALEGSSAIAVGNVIGSNVANLGLVLGLTALIRPLPVEASLLRRELPVMVATTFLLPPLLAGGGVSRPEAALLLLGAAAFTVVTARSIPKPAAPEEEAEPPRPPRRGAAALALMALVGLALLLGGGRLFVDGAAAAARALGVSERVVGLTVVAIGTSAPELAASLVATLRGHAAIAVGNVIGSCIFNVLFVLGGAGVIHPIAADLRAQAVDLSALGIVTVAAALLLRVGRALSRVDGGLLLGAYVAFLAVLVVV